MIGTWQAFSQENPSNIAILSRAIKPYTKNPKHDEVAHFQVQQAQARQVEVQQVVYYQAGVGTSPSYLEKLSGGAFGEGLKENVRDAYLFLCVNWSKGDEIYLFGFSRGAYTARVLSNLICDFGLLTKEGTDSWSDLYENYCRNSFNVDPKFKNRFEQDYPTGRVENVSVKFLGVFDTVGSMGVPQLYLAGVNLKPLNWLLEIWRAFSQFGNADLLPKVEFAFHAYKAN